MSKRSREASVSSESDTESDCSAQRETTSSPSRIRHSKSPHMDESGQNSDQKPVIRCFLPPHQPLSFTSYNDYDVHYQQAHVHRCIECHKNFPSNHYLNLHIAENHDPLNEVRKARGEKIYACFVEDCDRVCSAPQKRKMHLIDKHHFPKFYDFFIVNDGLDKRNSMLRPRHHRRPSKNTAYSSTQNGRPSKQISTKDGAPNGDEKEDQSGEHLEIKAAESSTPAKPVSKEQNTSRNSTSETGMEDITKSMSALKFVPPSVRFGRGRGGGFARR